MIAIFTIVASGVLAAIVTYRLNATKEHVFFMRQKAEELYLALERYDRSLSSYFLSYYALLKNELSYNDLLDLQTKGSNDDNGSGNSLNSATMLVNVYFPSLKSHLEAYSRVRGNIHTILAEHKQAYKRGETDGTPWFKPFHEAMLELGRVAASFKHAVLDEAIALAPADRLWPQSLIVPALQSKMKRLFRSR